MHVYIYARAACLVPFKIAREPADEGDPDFFPRFELSGIKGEGRGEYVYRVLSLVATFVESNATFVEIPLSLFIIPFVYKLENLKKFG